MAPELQVFVLVRVTVNAPVVRALLVRITHTGMRTGTPVNVNAACGMQPEPRGAIYSSDHADY